LKFFLTERTLPLAPSDRSAGAGQRARAETLNPVTVDVQAETPQLRQQLIVAEGVGRGAQRPAGVLELATDIIFGVRRLF
jgi:hypothetical protein